MRVCPKVRSWIIWVLVAVASVAGLYRLAPQGFLLLLGALYGGFQLGDVIYKGFCLAIPRTLIDDRRNRAVVITGCDSGFGHALAQKLDFLGLKVYACCLNSNGTGAKELKTLCSDKIEVVQMDVTKDDEIERVVNFVSATLGECQLWALVNNAGIGALTEFEWSSVDVFKRVLDVNTFGPARVTKAFLPLLREAGKGRVIITASLAGRVTFPGFVAYAVSKSGVISLADGLRRELKKWNISVHTIEPTAYKTPICSKKLATDQMIKTWSQCPQEIRDAYGEAYFEEFHRSVMGHLSACRPNIQEVIDVMVDAVIGESPEPRYVPSSVVQFRTRFLLSLPIDLLDLLLSRFGPKLPPAARYHGRRLLPKRDELNVPNVEKMF